MLLLVAIRRLLGYKSFFRLVFAAQEASMTATSFTLSLLSDLPMLSSYTLSCPRSLSVQVRRAIPELSLLSLELPSSPLLIITEHGG